ncbi:uncharacterized protein [Symphalangus syndactylus]|uniref:uncharacterized protein isoform X1 n=1 Tax=Symphalangus syndactylus TaxID=9590 RepID=UPI0030046DD5
MTAPKAFAGLSRPQRKGDPSSGLVHVKRDMAGKRTSPGGPACIGKGAGLDAAFTTTRTPRAVRLETTFPRGRRAERAGKRAFRVQCAGAKAIFGYIREVREAVRSFASAALRVWRFYWLQPGFTRYCPAREFPFCVWLEQPAGTEWILEEGVTTGPPRKPRADIYNLRSPDENWRWNMRGALWKEKDRPCAFMKVKICLAEPVPQGYCIRSLSLKGCAHLKNVIVRLLVQFLTAYLDKENKIF